MAMLQKKNSMHLDLLQTMQTNRAICTESGIKKHTPVADKMDKLKAIHRIWDGLLCYRNKSIHLDLLLTTQINKTRLICIEFGMDGYAIEI